MPNGYSASLRACEATFSSLHSGIISGGQRCQMPPTKSQWFSFSVWKWRFSSCCRKPNKHPVKEIWQPCLRMISASLHEKMDFFEEPPPFLPSSVTDTATTMRKHSENSNHQASASEQAFLLCKMTLWHLSDGSHTVYMSQHMLSEIVTKLLADAKY